MSLLSESMTQKVLLCVECNLYLGPLLQLNKTVCVLHVQMYDTLIKRRKKKQDRLTKTASPIWIFHSGPFLTIIFSLQIHCL